MSSVMLGFSGRVHRPSDALAARLALVVVCAFCGLG